MASVLRLAGMTAHCHNTFFDKEEEDHIWIPDIAKRKWIIVTSDKGIETDPVNRSAVLNSDAIVFILEDGTSRAANWAASIIVSRNMIYEAVMNHKAPFFMTISKETGFLVRGLRRPSIIPDSKTGETMVIHASTNDIKEEIEARPVSS